MHLSKDGQGEWPEIADPEMWPDITGTITGDGLQSPTLLSQEEIDALTPRSGARASQRNFLIRMMAADEGRYPPRGRAGLSAIRGAPVTPCADRMARLEPGLDPDDPKMDPKLAKILRENSDPTSASAAAARAWVRQQLEREKPRSFDEALEHSIISPSVPDTEEVAANRGFATGAKTLPSAQRLPAPGTTGFVLASGERGRPPRHTVGV